MIHFKSHRHPNLNSFEDKLPLLYTIYGAQHYDFSPHYLNLIGLENKKQYRFFKTRRCLLAYLLSLFLHMLAVLFQHAKKIRCIFSAITTNPFTFIDY